MTTRGKPIKFSAPRFPETRKTSYSTSSSNGSYPNYNSSPSRNSRSYSTSSIMKPPSNNDLSNSGRSKSKRSERSKSKGSESKWPEPTNNSKERIFTQEEMLTIRDHFEKIKNRKIHNNVTKSIKKQFHLGKGIKYDKKLYEYSIRLTDSDFNSILKYIEQEKLTNKGHYKNWNITGNKKPRKTLKKHSIPNVTQKPNSFGRRLKGLFRKK